MKKNNDLRTLTRLALLVAIELVMKAVGLGSVPMGPLYMSFLTLPIAVGAITMGPAAGAILGGVFGAVSFYDAVTGASAMTGALFQVSPVNTFILCVGMRVLMGLCVGLVFNGLKRFDKPGTWSYIVSAMCAPGLNTLFFMGYIVLAFYGCDYIQNIVAAKGAANPFMFVVLLVGVQGVMEFLVSGILGGIVPGVRTVRDAPRDQIKNPIKSQAPPAFCRGSFLRLTVRKMPWRPRGKTGHIAVFSPCRLVKMMKTQ